MKQDAPALGRSFALRAAVAYQGARVRVTRTFIDGEGQPASLLMAPVFED